MYMVIRELTTIKDLQDAQLDNITVYGLQKMEDLSDLFRFDRFVVLEQEMKQEVKPEHTEPQPPLEEVKEVKQPEKKQVTIPPVKQGFTKVEGSGTSTTPPKRDDFLYEDDRPLSDSAPIVKKFDADIDKQADRIIDKIMPLVSNKTFPIEDKDAPKKTFPPKPTFDRDWIKQLYREGKKTSEIAKIVGCSQATVYNVTRHCEWDGDD